MRESYRIIAAVLALVTVAFVIVSCSSEKDTETVPATTMQVTEAVTEPLIFKEKDFGGKEVVFLMYNEHATKYVDSYIVPDRETGDAISEAVHNRNADVENKFNVKIVTDEVFSPKNEAISRIHSGQSDFDVIYEWGTELSTLALGGQLQDLEKLSTVHLDRNYWLSKTRADLSVGGKTFVATSYITMNSIDYAQMLFFNKTMYKDLGFTDSLYDHALYGTWTFDKYVETAVSAVSDLDGDGNMTSSDRFGIWGDSVECISKMIKSSGQQNTSRNDDGSYSLTMYSESAVDIYTKYANRVEKSNVFITYEDVWADKPNLTDFASRNEGARYVGFGRGHVLFMPGSLSMTDEFLDMNDDFGILPNPRYNEDQEGYYHLVDSAAPMLSIPADSSSPANTGCVLDYMSYVSEQQLLPAYAKSVTESKKNVDPMDRVMFDIIRNSVRYDWTEIYELDVTVNVLDKMIVSGSFKSVYDRLYTKAKSEVDSCIASIAFLGIN